ncbi:uncharacterized protein [Miscanthus floridulus]|uniref:uncharacterized protein n=1 Tax=Miscanthus floridulus TaxID=154761 RepID=UPI00345AEA55
MAGAEALGTTEAMMAEAEAPGATEADVIAAKPLAQEVEMKAAEASVAPLSRDDPEGEPLFTLEDVAEDGRWDTFEQYHQLAEWSRRTALSVVADDLPSVAQSAEVENLHLRCANAKAEAATAQEQVAPLAAWVKELEEELARVAGDRDASRSWAEEAMASGKVLAGKLGAEQKLGREASRVAEASRVEAQRLKEKAEASRVEAQHWKEKAEASRVEAQRWKEKAEELEKEVTQVAEASVAVQAVLETEIGEHDALKSPAHSAYEALEVEGV